MCRWVFQLHINVFLELACKRRMFKYVLQLYPASEVIRYDAYLTVVAFPFAVLFSLCYSPNSSPSSLTLISSLHLTACNADFFLFCDPGSHLKPKIS